MYKGLIQFIECLEKEEELVRVKDYVNPVLEITEITHRVCKQPGGGKALLFENTGTDFPLLINALGSEKRMALALGRENLQDIEAEITALFHKLASPKDTLWEKLRMLPQLKEVSSWMPEKIKGKGRGKDMGHGAQSTGHGAWGSEHRAQSTGQRAKSEEHGVWGMESGARSKEQGARSRGTGQEVVMDEPDLFQLPILKCWPADGGRFITLPAVHTVDPETSAPNVGMYRMQVFDKTLTGMHWHRHKTGAAHFAKYKALGRRMPVTVTLGGDPVYTYAATAPMPENMDEYLLAGFLRKRKVRLVQCLTNDLWVPENVDFVIEGYVDPREELIWEGPFGDHTGFYSLADWYPRFHVTCITHRKDAVYPATIVGIPPMEDAWIGKATERIFLSPIRLTMIPELTDMYLPFAGVAHNISIVKIRKTYPGQAVKVMHALWGAGQMMFNKILVVVDEETEKLAVGSEQLAGELAVGSEQLAGELAGELAVGSKQLAESAGHGAKKSAIVNLQSAFANKIHIGDWRFVKRQGAREVFQNSGFRVQGSKWFEVVRWLRRSKWFEGFAVRRLRHSKAEHFIQDSGFKIQDSRSRLPTADCQLPTLSNDIHSTVAISRLFRENFDPEYSLHFSKGPLDILDHSSSAFAFGSKLGIDLTRPFPEEIPSGKPSNSHTPPIIPNVPSMPGVLSVPNVLSSKTLFENLSLPVLLLTLRKDETYSKSRLEKELSGLPGAEHLKAILLFDEGADLNDHFTLVWLLGGNLEPERDISVLQTPAKTSLVLVDATIKTARHDHFTRDWPNIVTMDDQTIADIDRKWPELGLGALFPSPSLKVKALVKGKGAVRE